MKRSRLATYLLYDVINCWRCVTGISVRRMCLLQLAGSQAVLVGYLSRVGTNNLSLNPYHKRYMRTWDHVQVTTCHVWETLPCVRLLSHTGVFLLCESALRNHYLTGMFGPSGHVEACHAHYLSARVFKTFIMVCTEQ